MKQIIDVFNESILDKGFESDPNVDKKVLAGQVWDELSKDWGSNHSILFGACFGGVFNGNLVDFDKKGRIIFKNMPKELPIMLDYELVNIPDCVRKYGWGDLELTDKNKTVVVKNSGNNCKLSDLGFKGKVNGVLELRGGWYEIDEIPDFKVVRFTSCNFKNIIKMPKKKPKGTVLVFDSYSQDNIFAAWSGEVLKKYPAVSDHSSAEIYL